MTKLLTSIFVLMMLAPLAKANDSDDMSEFRRPRPGSPSTVYRCCSKGNDGGRMYCSQNSDHILAWWDAILKCEQRYGSGNCVSGCRRIF